MKTYLRYALILLLLAPLAARADEDKPLGGSVEAEIDGRHIAFPLLKTDINAELAGDLATVNVTQTFSNPTTVPIHAVYLFPLHQDAAVYHMTMEVGDERVEAQIQKIEDARKTFEEAKTEGKAASLLVQHRPNMFTQNIANLMPGKPIKVTISYVHSVKKVDGQYELAIPLVVGPRYQPDGAGTPPTTNEQVSSSTAFGKWELQELPAYPEVIGLTIPKIIDEDRVALHLHLKSGIPIHQITSATHAIHVTKTSAKEDTITLKSGKAIDNRDFVLRYQLAGDATQAGLLAHQDERGGFFSLMLEPPAIPDAKDISPREMVFVLDTSGSMSGEPVEASKLFMRHALNALRPQDYFRIIRFSNNASEFTSGPVSATQEHIKSGQQYVDGLTADGGTEAMTAIDQAFRIQPQPGTMRIVVFLTDGYIGNEAQILEAIHKQLADARIYALGVGTSTNRYLLEEMAQAGKGFARFIDPSEKSDDVAIELAHKLETPVLTDISIDWGKLAPKNVAPVMIPDLFAGGNLRIQGKYAQQGTYTIAVNGKVNGRKARMPLTVTLNSQSDAGEAIPLIWARTQIADKMRQYSQPQNLRAGNASDDTLKEEITQLGLDYALATQWTSFVAVSRTVVNEHPEDAQDTSVPLPQVKGVGPKAYPKYGSAALQNTSFSVTQNFSGSSAPEPEVFAGLILILVAARAGLRRKQAA